jgi:hypothetical protein
MISQDFVDLVGVLAAGCCCGREVPSDIVQNSKKKS